MWPHVLRFLLHTTKDITFNEKHYASKDSVFFIVISMHCCPSLCWGGWLGACAKYFVRVLE